MNYRKFCIILNNFVKFFKITSGAKINRTDADESVHMFILRHLIHDEKLSEITNTNRMKNATEAHRQLVDIVIPEDASAKDIVFGSTKATLDRAYMLVKVNKSNF